MTTPAESLLQSALELEPGERAELAARLLESLPALDPQVSARWLEEAYSRLAAFEAGELGAVDARDLFTELRSSS